MNVPDFKYLSKSVRMKVINAFDKTIQHQNEITEQLRNYPKEVIEYEFPPGDDPKHHCHGICTSLTTALCGGKHTESELEELTEFMYALTDEISSRLGNGNYFLQHWLVDQGYLAATHYLRYKVNAVKLSETRTAWLKSLKEEFCHEHESQH